MPEEGNVIIRGAKVNNLKDISVEIPRNQFVVVTGISGSGKSSLAFDTLFAEGQRRFAESLSSYARQFLGRMSKPDVEAIEGIPPAIAIEQKVNVRNPRSTVATTTEIYDYLRIIFARIGRTYSPVTGEEVKCHSVNDVMACILKGDARTAYILAPLGWKERTDKVELMLQLKEEGYSRFFCDGQIIRIEEVMKRAASGDYPEDLLLLVDRNRLPVMKGNLPWNDDGTPWPQTDWEDLQTRLRASIDTAFREGNGRLVVRKELDAGDAENGELRVETTEFSNRFELDGMTFREPDEYLFSFNSPLGACPVCGGLGKIIGVSEDLVVPDKTLSIYDGAIACWRGDKMGWFKDRLVRLADRYGIRIFEPYCNLSQQEKDLIWKSRSVEGDDDSLVGINEFFQWVESNRYKVQYRFMLSRFSGRTTCHACHGSRLRPEALYVKVGGRNIAELLRMNVDQLLKFFSELKLTDYEAAIVRKAVEEVVSRLRYIQDVGLSYLTLDRTCNTLSGGETQRINLVTALGSSLVGSMYILDEPSIGLHSRDTERLIAVLRRLRDIGNTVIVVEHDEEIIRAADMVIDLGPKAGVDGGEIVFQGRISDPISESQLENSLTLQYLTGRRSRYQREKRPWSYSITVEGAREHNLKNIDVRFPLGALTVVSGVSGSGKSSLVGDILHRALYRRINQTGDLPGLFSRLSGNLDRVTRVEYVDQNPIGRSSRSNAVTYLKVYDDIRKLLADQQYAKINGYTPSFFSFNQDGGRCPECQGEGFVKIGMQFMADVTMVCEACGGKRFKPDILEVRYKGRNIDDILNMSVEEAIAFFRAQSEEMAGQIARRLQPLVDVGLSYIKLGQTSSTLSGGESQRIKLAYFLAMSADSDSVRREKILFLFDEPTTGLHFYDVEKLLKSFDALIDKGHTVIVVEHNPDVIRSADWVIDLGPDAGDAGGEVVFAGTPEQLAAQGGTFTARYLSKT
ncbi:MAG: excinuclease ABC subunit UvrA [Bacteroidales bacterium]|jgi:excinuclease ABC subunit A|nr:excinuclease ABC subunit UvrA [Bacteroidota bacterium]NLN98924.1 excinuclease ABC subunit UvrA [Bacteroidales bacterium]